MRVRRRELVEREPVRRAFRHAAITARDAVLAVPDRVSAVLAAESDPDALHARLTEELRAALERLADDRHQLAAEAEATAGTEETNG